MTCKYCISAPEPEEESAWLVYTALHNWIVCSISIYVYYLKEVLNMLSNMWAEAKADPRIISNKKSCLNSFVVAISQLLVPRKSKEYYYSPSPTHLMLHRYIIPMHLHSFVRLIILEKRYIQSCFSGVQFRLKNVEKKEWNKNLQILSLLAKKK